MNGGETEEDLTSAAAHGTLAIPLAPWLTPGPITRGHSDRQRARVKPAPGARV